MAVLASQVAMSLAMLAFAVAALAVARELRVHAPRYRFAWALTGWTFLVEGTNSLAHDVFAIIAFSGGPESGAWAAVLRWHPPLNHSRTFLLATYCVVLAVALYRSAHRERETRVAPAMAVICGGMLVGGVVGWLEPEFTNLRHYSAVAVYDIVLLAALMGLLLVGLAAGGMDRALWSALSINGLVVALSVLLFAAVAQIGVLGQWWPQPLYVQSFKAVLRVLMVAVAVTHVIRIRRGRPVRGLLEPPRRASELPSLHTG